MIHKYKQLDWYCDSSRKGNVETKLGNKHYTSVKDPVNRPFGDNIFIVPDEIHFLPNVTKKAIHVSLTQIISSIKPIRAKNSNLQVRGGTLLVGI